MNEFELIRRHFAALTSDRDDVLVGVGDDCALVQCPPGQVLAVSIDALVSGVHFLPDCDPGAIGHKSLAVGLSDLAAVGAEPAWATLALTLPSALAAGDALWVERFAAGFGGLAGAHGVALVGGDTTRGHLAVSVQVHGFVPLRQAVRRSGACVGDLVCVSGTLGDAGLALRRLLDGDSPDDWLRGRLEQPTPRVALGLALRGVVSAMIDCSDGLAADLGHILDASGVGAVLDLTALPLSPQVALVVRGSDDWSLPLASGDDYELCFCLPPDRADGLSELAASAGCKLSVIGRTRQEPGLICRSPDGAEQSLGRRGFDHFNTGDG